MSTTVTKKTYNGKKNYYGKWYSYKKIRNLMNTYFRAKLTSTIHTVVHLHQAENQPDRWTLQLRVGNNDAVGVTLSALVVGCPKWGTYRTVFGYYKCRGIVIEVVPGIETPPMVVNNNVIIPYRGNIALGLTNEPGEQTFNDILEDNMKIAFSRTQTVRKYFPFFVKDFSQCPDQDNVRPGGIPYNLFIATATALENEHCQQFQLNFTFYITFRQSVS
jgi:hypothetical protein